MEMSGLTVTISNVAEKVIAILGGILHMNVLSPLTNRYSLPLVMFIPICVCVLLMFGLKFINFVEFGESLKLLLKKDSSVASTRGEKPVSSIKSLMALVAGSAGLGNIVGVPMIVTVAGPGAAFWILLVPLIVSPLRFGEVFAGHNYRIRNDDGSFSGGPSYYMRNGLKSINLPRIGIVLSFIYSICFLVSGMGGPSAMQSNQVVRVIINQFPKLGGSELMLSVCFTLFVAAVLFGGLKRVINFLSFMAPVIIIVYFVSVLLVLIGNYDKILPTIQLIVSSAFGAKSASVGILSGFILALTRVMVATETGIGTAAVMHSNSSNKDSVREGIISMSSPMIGAFFICFSTTFLVLVTGVYQKGCIGVGLISDAFATFSPHLRWVVFAMVPLMASNVAIAWGFYGESGARSFFNSKIAGKIYLVIYIGSVLAGGMIKDFGIVLRLTDVVNTSLIVPNVIAIAFLYPVMSKAYTAYKAKDLN